MWLLDHNIPRQVHHVLKQLGIESFTTKHKGWENLKNGALTDAAYRDGFRCIVTLDRLFRESASKVLAKYPDLSLVLVTLEQESGPVFAANFLEAWKGSPIQLKPGQLIEWPGDSAP